MPFARLANRRARLSTAARVILGIAAFGISAATPLAAQRVLGPSPDATTLRRGTLRTSLESESILLRGRWADGESQPLGAGLGGPLTFRRVPGLISLQGDLIALDLAVENPSLGDAQLDLRQRLAVTRLGFEYGLSDRITLRARAEASLGLDASSASAGLSPGLFGTGVFAANRTIVDAYDAAASALTARRDDCVNNAGAHPECATILAEAVQVDAAIARASPLAG
ncbi:MAG TPA: hypothetical protein PK788_14390, partial [Gemmatimonadaceae bacterium]|nr:hypothetical protein [Gemmatimonadaceae bacterium]